METATPREDPLIDRLLVIIRWAVRALAVLMTFVIVMGVVDVVWMLYQRMTNPPVPLLDISEILATFGAFLAVLIAIEIFANITMYLREDVIPVDIVMATAVIAAARKVIVLDLKELSAPHVWGVAAIVVAVSGGYWLILRSSWRRIPVGSGARLERPGANRVGGSEDAGSEK